MTTLKDINCELDTLDFAVERISTKFSPNKYSTKKKSNNYDWLYDNIKKTNYHPPES